MPRFGMINPTFVVNSAEREELAVRMRSRTLPSEDVRRARLILMLADGNGDFAKAVGLDQDLSAPGMGLRSKRYSMLVEDGVVKQLNVEDKGGVNVSGADTILTQL